MPFDIQVSRGFHVTEDSESIDRFHSTQFYMSDFFSSENQRCFNQNFKDSWESATPVFFATHTPFLIFISFGQNMEIENATGLVSYLSKDFLLETAIEVQVSVAVNFGYRNSENSMENDIEPVVDEGQYSSRLEDSSINHIREVPTDHSAQSVVMTEDGVKALFGYPSFSSCRLFRKAFNPAFTNFQADSVADGLALEIPECFSILGFQGYSTVSHLLRRTSKNEPFTSRPFAKLVQVSPTSSATIKKYLKVIQQDLRNLQQDVTAMEEKGSDYRLELTIGLSGSTYHDLETQLNGLIDNFRRSSTFQVERNCFLVPTNVFPKAIKLFSKLGILNIRPIADRFFQSPRSVTIEEKEYGVFLENLVAFA
jgi:hypothetical protein